MSEQTIDEWGVTAAERDEARRYSMTITWSDEDEVFIVRFPDAPGVVTHGTTLEEATEQGEDAIITWLTGLHDADLPVPPPLTARTVVVAGAPRFDAVHIQQLRHRLNVSQRVFAEMLNVSLSTVRHWEQGLRTPDGASRRLLEIAERDPTVLEQTRATA
jgi:DNA-binding transcriptional regulator YiaG